MKQKYSSNYHKSQKDIVFTVRSGEPDKLLEYMYFKMPERSAKSVKAFLVHNQVSVDKKRTTRYDYPLAVGQTVTICREISAQPPKSKLLSFIFENDEFIVINKPAGLLTVSTDKENEKTAYRLVNDYVSYNDRTARVFIVHRLDKDTSGVVLFAKNDELKHMLQDNWDKLVTCREYIALCEGTPKQKSGRIESYLKETVTHLMYSAHSGTDGKKAVTDYTVISEGNGLSLIKVNLLTGRKNQIRVHMKDIGCQVTGDKKYESELNPIGRLGLHASKLILTHPVTGEKLSFEAPISGKFEAALNINE